MVKMVKKMVKKITKKQLLKKEKRKTKSRLKKELSLAKLYVKARDNYTCQICKRDLKNKVVSQHVHHILPDIYLFKHIRADTRNLILLCPRCHRFGPLSAHQNSIFFGHWLKTNKETQYVFVLEELKRCVRTQKYKDSNTEIQQNIVNLYNKQSS